MTARPVAKFLILICLALAGAVTPAKATTIRDAYGRVVEVATPVRRMVLNDASLVLSLALLTDDPALPIAGWAGEFRLDPDLRHALEARFPAAAKIASVGGNDLSLSIESVIAASPDVLVVSGLGPEAVPLDVFDRLGVPVVFIDLPADDTASILAETYRSLEILGQLLEETGRAADFIAFHRERAGRIIEGLRDLAGRPRVLVHAHADLDEPCCMSPGARSDYIEFSGGENIGRSLLPVAIGQISLESVIAADPDVYVATGGKYAKGGVRLGPGADPVTAKDDLRKLVETGYWSRLEAVRSGRVHALWHGLLATPLNILALEAMAKWFQPQRFGEVDPAETLRLINSRYLSLTLDGALWTSLPDL